MSDPVEIALIVAASSVIPSFLTYLNGRASLRRSEAMKQQIAIVHDDVNGKMEQLIQVSGDARQAIGRLDGLAEAAMEAQKPKGGL
jgi:hypothetical protein